MPTPIVEVTGLSTWLGERWVHRNLDLSVQRGEILVIAGGSGTGKTVLLRTMIDLIQPAAGTVSVMGQVLSKLTEAQRVALQERWGVLFQQNALFSSLSILDNVAFPLREKTRLDQDMIRELALLKLLLAGLKPEVASRYPAELSGGMQKRAALARAIVLDPEIVFLDEPTAGLDPPLVAAFDRLILNLQQSLGFTIVMVTHDLQSIRRTANRVAFLGEGRVLCVEPPEQVVQFPHPLVQAFFAGQ